MRLSDAPENDTLNCLLHEKMRGKYKNWYFLEIPSNCRGNLENAKLPGIPGGPAAVPFVIAVAVVCQRGLNHFYRFYARQQELL